MDRMDCIDWWVLGPKYRARVIQLESALKIIDEVGNGLRPDGITAYADLMHCGAIARMALNAEKG